MKTSTSEVRCDQCQDVIPAMTRLALFVTLRGPDIGHKKADFCDWDCFQRWVNSFASGPR